jgi:hypothetical protein
MYSFDLGAFKPATGSPQNIATVECLFTLTDIDTGLYKEYRTYAQGSDTLDKAVNGATTYAFRNWFNKNFSPCIWNGVKQTFGDEGANVSLDVAQDVVKTEAAPRVFVTPNKKEEIKKEIVSTPQKTENNPDVVLLTSLIYEYRELIGDDSAGANKLAAIANGEYDDVKLTAWITSFQNAIDSKKGGNN